MKKAGPESFVDNALLEAALDKDAGFVKHLYNHPHNFCDPESIHGECAIDILKVGLVHYGKKCGATQTNFAHAPEILRAFLPWICQLTAHRESSGTLCVSQLLFRAQVVPSSVEGWEQLCTNNC